MDQSVSELERTHQQSSSSPSMVDDADSSVNSISRVTSTDTNTIDVIDARLSILAISSGSVQIPTNESSPHSNVRFFSNTHGFL